VQASYYTVINTLLASHAYCKRSIYTSEIDRIR